MLRLPHNILFILMVAGTTLGTSCGGKEDKNSSERFSQRRGSMSATFEESAIPVKVEPVTRQSISTYILTNTTLEAERQVDVVTKVSGIVEKLLVEEGDRVKAHQVLAKLDERELELELLQAEVRANNTKRNLDRAQDMFSKNLISRENFEDAKYQYETAKAQYEAAKLKVEYTDIRSPIAGVVTSRMIEIGDRVNTNQKVFTVADYDTLLARIHVPEKELGKISVGQKAKINLEAVSGRDFWGTVKMVSPVVDPASGTIKITIEIPRKGGLLRPGMFASVYIVTETHPRALVIPKKALLLESEIDRVFVYRQGVAHQANLKLGFAEADKVEVLDGLKEGDLVVTVGQEGLREGARVRISEEKLASARSDTTRKLTPSAQPQPTTSGVTAESRGFPQIDPEKLRRWEKRMLEIPMVKEEYEKRVKADPELKTDPRKKIQFFREMMRKMRR